MSSLLSTLAAPVLVPLAQAAPAQGGAAGLLSSLPMVLIMVGIFYFLLIRPQQQEAKKHQELLASLKKGDQVVTASGLHGSVAEVRDDTVLIEVSSKVKLMFDKTAVKRKPGAEGASSGSSDKKGG